MIQAAFTLNCPVSFTRVCKKYKIVESSAGKGVISLFIVMDIVWHGEKRLWF